MEITKTPASTRFGRNCMRSRHAKRRSRISGTHPEGRSWLTGDAIRVLARGNHGSARTRDPISKYDTKMSDANEALHCHVSGRVQGVFFRASTREKAQELG